MYVAIYHLSIFWIYKSFSEWSSQIYSSNVKLKLVLKTVQDKQLTSISQTQPGHLDLCAFLQQPHSFNSRTCFPQIWILPNLQDSIQILYPSEILSNFSRCNYHHWHPFVLLMSGLAIYLIPFMYYFGSIPSIFYAGLLIFFSAFIVNILYENLYG